MVHGEYPPSFGIDIFSKTDTIQLVHNYVLFIDIYYMHIITETL
ncbi:hypothetical protein HMPREF9406_0644 [Clostridium sp. HGF2]|nr:hypothetical protein HMPREF9406_0644 [Clostridium sp. HGF2]EQJ58594.1 hypothetical protein QSI_1876 [Clostridioides difficile P28]